MDWLEDIIGKKYNNFIFIGEAGSGKSEIAINLARYLKLQGDKPVHLFDMDMTKPLFRSRDIQNKVRDMGIELHFQRQFMDAPTLVGGVRHLFKDAGKYTVIDVGGDYIGARSIGGFAPLVNNADTIVYYVMNVFRPWSSDLKRIDRVLGEILGVSHIQLENVHLISNPNIGPETTVADALAGNYKLMKMVALYKQPDFVCVKAELAEAVKTKMKLPVMPVQLFLKYPWIIDNE